ncbi:hypothetical protein BLNAU_17003 [Blattamonas nauphoetae]|uniref:Protein kinase domain-containing protein n=1 Tax=Blattamonas nauphoetae TaxID=2049346 RepID=A0ABQ9XCN6_9EUKA|nr:hypothetical protein BLNAU_17003 [Blattamonas nauphoetae]
MLDPTSLHPMNMRVVGADQRNTLTFVRECPTDFLFCIENTTLSLESLWFDGRNSRICHGTADTFFSLSNCVVDDCGHHAILESDGWLSAISSKFSVAIGMTSHGLVDSPSESCHFVLSGSIFQNWRTTEETSLTGTAFDQLDVSFCRFSNVSQTHSVILQPLHRTFQTTSIVGCDLNEVENNLYGSISRDMNNHNSIHAANTTFSRNFHSEFNAYTTTFTSQQNTSITLQTSFSDCQFLRCTSNANGGGIYHFSSSSLTVSNCKFDGCRAEPTQTLNTIGGGICFYSTSGSAVSVTVTGTTFVSCFAHTGGGVYTLHNSAFRNIKAELKNCHFEALSAVYQCAGFYLGYVNNPSISNTVIQDCSNPQFDGGGRVVYGAGKLTMDSISFLRLQAEGNGAFALDIHSGTAAFSNLRVADCITNNNSPFVIGTNIDKTGSDTFKFQNCPTDIAFHGAALYASKSIFVNCWTASGQPSVYAKGESRHDWIVTNEVIQVVNATGVDKLFCWAPGNQCKTMTDVIGNRLGPWYVGKIAMGEGEYHERKLEMKNQSLVVEGSGKTKTTMIDGGSSGTLFTITTGTLTASAITFVPSTSSHLITLSSSGTVSVRDSSVQSLETNVKLSKSVFSVSAGTLHLTRVDCSSLSFTATTVLFLFSSSAHSLTLTNSSFTSISSGGSGSCIFSTITTGQSVKIGEEGGSDSFSSCSSVGDGGALNVKLVDAGSLSIVSTRFSKCSSNGVGGGLFVDLSSTTSQTKWTLNLSGATFGRDAEKNTATKGPNLFVTGKFFETVVTPSIFPDVTGADETDMWSEDSNTTVHSSLLVYLVPFSNKMIVGGSNGFDIDHCGHFGVGCVSIQNALNHVKTSGSDTLILSFESGATLSESFSFETSQTTSFESSSESHQTIEVLGSGKLSVSLGKLSLKKLSFSTTVASFLSSLITLNGGSLALTGCNFTGFRSSVSGGIVSGIISSSSSLVVSESSFVSCSSSLNGGGIAVECAENTPSSSLVIKASFRSCSCGDGKKGDWVFVSGKELSKLIVPSNWESTTSGLSQPSDSSKLWGVDSLPCGLSLSSSTLLVYLIGHSGSSLFTSSSTGSDVIGCGESSTPCRALSTSFNHLSSAGSNTLSVIDSSTLDFVLTNSFPSLTITGTSSPSKPLSVTSTGRFSVPSNTLSITHLCLSPSSAPFSSSLITISGPGIVSVTLCSFSSFSLSQTPLIDHQNGELKLKSSSFSSIHRSEGSGSCLHSALMGDMKLSVDDLPSSQSSTVVVQMSVEIVTSIAFTSSTILTGLTESSQLVVGENAQFQVQTDDVNLDLSSLVVGLPSELSSSCLFLSSKGSLSFEAVSFVSSDPANVFSSQLILSTTPLSLTDVNVTSVSLSGVGLIESWSDVSVSGCHFTSISRSTGLGSVIDANISETTKMKVIDSSFDGCVCDSTTNWILLKGVNTETNDHSSWKDTFSLTSPRSSVLVLLHEHEPFSLIYELYPPGASLVVSSSSSDDHRLCGNESVPCRTISGSDCASGGRSFSVRGSCLMGGELWIETEGLWIEGLNSNVGTVLMDGTSRIVQKVGDYPKPVTLRHVCVDVSSSTLNSESSILHLETGTLDMSSCSFKSSQTIGMKLLSMASGILKFNSISLSSLSFSTTPIVLTSLTEATLEHVTISDCVTSHIISASSIPSLTLQTVVIERVMTSLLNTDYSNVSKMEELCHWTGGVVSLEHCTTVVRVSLFSDVDEGAFSLDGGLLGLHSCTFEETHDESTFFPSAHRNIVCQNEGNVSIHTPNGGDGSSILPSLWIDSSNCTLSKNSQPITAPLFIPTLDTTKSTSKTSKKMITITLAGTLLMPCDLHLEVFSVEANKAETCDVQSLDLSSIGINWNETSMTVELNENYDFPNLKREHEWHARLAFGLGTDRTGSFRVKLSLSDERKAQAKAAMKWMIPLIAGIAALLVLVLILLLVLRKRKKDKEQKKTKLSEMGEVDQAMDDIAKMDDPSLAMTDNLRHFSYDTPTETNKTDENSHFTLIPIPPNIPLQQKENEADQANTTVIARGPDGKEVHVTLSKDTLYNRLHGPNPDLQLNSAQLRVQLVAALTAVHKHSTTSEVLARLNPHVVFFDSAGVVCLQVNQHPHPQASDGEKQMKREEELDRWKAPEVANGEVKVDHQQAAVFSLGLLFWEMETGMVPFRELDAVNAQRQLGTGERPPMDRIKSESLVELIEQCLDLEPENRPTFSELEKMLCPPSLHQPSQPLSRPPVPLLNKASFTEAIRSINSTHVTFISLTHFQR